MNAPLALTLSSRHALVDAQRLDIDVYFNYRQTQRLFDFILDITNEVVGNLGDAQAVFQNDVHVDGDMIVDEAHGDATAILVLRKERQRAEVGVRGGDAYDAVTADDGVAGERRDGMGRHLNLAARGGHGASEGIGSGRASGLLHVSLDLHYIPLAAAHQCRCVASREQQSYI